MRGQSSEVRGQKGCILCACGLLVSLLIGLMTSTAWAQASSVYGKDVNQVYVRDSAIAVDKFALANRMEHLQEWSKAADVYHEVLTNFADRVVPTEKTAPASRI